MKIKIFRFNNLAKLDRAHYNDSGQIVFAAKM